MNMVYAVALCLSVTSQCSVEMAKLIEVIWNSGFCLNYFFSFWLFLILAHMQDDSNFIEIV